MRRGWSQQPAAWTVMRSIAIGLGPGDHGGSRGGNPRGGEGRRQQREGGEDRRHGGSEVQGSGDDQPLAAQADGAAGDQVDIDLHIVQADLPPAGDAGAQHRFVEPPAPPAQIDV